MTYWTYNMIKDINKVFDVLGKEFSISNDRGRAVGLFIMSSVSQELRARPGMSQTFYFFRAEYCDREPVNFDNFYSFFCDKDAYFQK